MADIEKTIKGLEQFTLWIKNGHKICLDNPDDFWAELYEMGEDALALLKEQEAVVKQWTKEIADNQLAHAPDELDRENWDYKKGIWDGLQIAWNIISEGR